MKFDVNTILEILNALMGLLKALLGANAVA